MAQEDGKKELGKTGEADKKMLNRENLRLEMSLQDAVKKYGKDKEIILCMHYPPTAFIHTMKKYNVKQCIYGHLHGEPFRRKNRRCTRRNRIQIGIM